MVGMIYDGKWQIDGGGARAPSSGSSRPDAPPTPVASSPESTLVGLPAAELADVSGDDGWVSYEELKPDLWRSEPGPRMTCCDVLTALLVPWAAFVLSLVIFICLYHDHAILVWILQILCTLLALCTVVTGHRVRDAMIISLGFLSLASIALGAAAGTWLEAEYLQRFWQLYRASSFQMILPSSDPNKIPMDSFLRFSDGTVLEESHSLGYLAKGNTYCVAPLRLDGGDGSVRYWAVGKNCCERRGKFNCGPQPQHAAVIAERLDEIFHRAVLQASSVFHLAVEPGVPQLVTLIEHPSQLLADAVTEMWYESTRVAVMAGLMHLAVCFIAVLTMATASAYGRKLKDSL